MVNIVRTPGVCGGNPRIEGHRITVQLIAERHVHLGWEAGEIAEAFQLTQSEVHAALAYYYEHQEEIERAIREDREALEKLPKLADMLDDDALSLVTTPQEVAEIYPIKAPTVYQAIRRGRLPARKSGGTWLILRADAERLWGRRLRKARRASSSG